MNCRQLFKDTYQRPARLFRVALLVFFVGSGILLPIQGQDVDSPDREPAPDLSSDKEDASTLKPLEWQILPVSGVFEFDADSGSVDVRDGAILNYNDPEYGFTQLTANEAGVNESTGDIYARGDVLFTQGSQIWSGESIWGNLKQQQWNADAFRAGHPPAFVGGTELKATGDGQWHEIKGGYVTTSDLQKPTYRIAAESIKFHPGERVIAKNARLYVGRVPVFYFPYYNKNLDADANQFLFTPGYRKIFGPFLLTEYQWNWKHKKENPAWDASGSWHTDYRLKRGVGFGPDVEYRSQRYGDWDFKGYYAPDEEPGFEPDGSPIESGRNRLWLTHRLTLSNGVESQFALRRQSDSLLLKEYFESEYRLNVQPSSFWEVSKRWRNMSLSVLTQAQVNPFQETTERLPDIKFSVSRAQIGVTPLFYEGESSVAYLRRRFALGSVNQDYEAWRTDSFHQILYPKTFFGWLNVTPRVGGRWNYYSEATSNGNQILKSQNRWIGVTGVEFSAKASRVWKGVENKALDLKELRHIVEPMFNYAYTPNPTVGSWRLPQFDRQFPSLKLLPIDFPDYNSIDTIDASNTLRLGMRNKLQTWREDQMSTWVQSALFVDWRLDKNRGQSTFSNVYSDLDFKPREWMTFTSETRYDPSGGVFRESNHYLTLNPNPIWAASLGHRYLDGADPVFAPALGSNLIYSGLYLRLTENWGLNTRHYFEARDGVLEDQYYTLYRDLESWTSGLTFRVRESRNGPTDFSIAITISLKASPSVKLGKDRDHPILLLGG